MRLQYKSYSCDILKCVYVLGAMFLAISTACSASEKSDVNDVFFITTSKTLSDKTKDLPVDVSQIEVTEKIYLSQEDSNVVNIALKITNNSTKDITISRNDLRCAFVRIFRYKLPNGAISLGRGKSQPLFFSGKFPARLRPGESATFFITKDVARLNRFTFFISWVDKFKRVIEFERKKIIITENDNI